MGLKDFRKMLGWVMLFFLTLACVSPLAVAAPATPVPLPQARMQETLDAAIAGTAAVAQTQTETARPPTSTPTSTQTPSQTPTVTFTPTPTFYYSLFTATSAAPVLETSIAATQTASYLITNKIVDLGAGYYMTAIPTERWTHNNQWRCSVKYSPNLVVSPGKKFYAGWTVVNTGWNAWSSNTIDFLYRSGLRGGNQNRYDIPSTVAYGKSLNVGAYFTAPKRLGTYNSRYILVVDASKYTLVCDLRMTVRVE